MVFALGGQHCTPESLSLSELFPATPGYRAHGAPRSESWPSSALALALRTGQRTMQRSLEAMAAAGKVRAFGRGRARRWVTPLPPGFTPTFLLPAPQLACLRCVSPNPPFNTAGATGSIPVPPTIKFTDLGSISASFAFRTDAGTDFRTEI